MTVTPEQAAAAQATGQAATSAQENAQPEAERQATGNKLTDQEAALLKENMAMKSKISAFEAQQQAAAKKALEEQGNFKQLAEIEKSKADGLASRLIKAELLAKLPGIIDPELIKLCDTSTVKIADDGSIEGLAEIAAAFIAAKPSFFSAGDQKPVVPGTPKPGVVTGASGFATYADYEKAPYAERTAWAEKNPTAFKALADMAMQQKR